MASRRDQDGNVQNGRRDPSVSSQSSQGQQPAGQQGSDPAIRPSHGPETPYGTYAGIPAAYHTHGSPFPFHPLQSSTGDVQGSHGGIGNSSYQYGNTPSNLAQAGAFGASSIEDTTTHPRPQFGFHQAAGFQIPPIMDPSLLRSYVPYYFDPSPSMQTGLNQSMPLQGQMVSAVQIHGAQQGGPQGGNTRIGSGNVAETADLPAGNRSSHLPPAGETGDNHARRGRRRDRSRRQSAAPRSRRDRSASPLRAENERLRRELQEERDQARARLRERAARNEARLEEALRKQKEEMEKLKESLEQKHEREGKERQAKEELHSREKRTKEEQELWEKKAKEQADRAREDALLSQVVPCPRAKCLRALST
jgi:hypothetical protein